MSSRLNTGILVSLCIVFLSYSVMLYLPGEINNTSIGEGRLVWQKYNCQACHQLYGLGGYLGPDLTNLTSTPGKSEKYIRAMILSGTEQMPSFKLNETELNMLIRFLQEVDKTGDGRIGAFKVNWDGMISEHHE